MSRRIKKQDGGEGSPVVAYTLGKASSAFAVGQQDASQYGGVPCLAFDGVDGRIDTPSRPTSSSGTIEVVWCGIPTATPLAFSRIVSNHTLGNLASTGFSLYQRLATELRWQCYANGIETTLSWNTYTAGTYVELRGVINLDTGFVAFYSRQSAIEAWVLRSSITREQYIGQVFDSGETIRIGDKYGPSIPYEGTMCHVSVSDGTNNSFDYPLSASSGTTAYDVSGNGNDGTLSGGVTRTTADGISDYLTENGFTPSVVSSGGGAIELPFSPDINTKVRHVWKNDQSSFTSNHALFGAYSGGGAVVWAYYSSGAALAVGYGGFGVVIDTADNLVHEITIENGLITYDGVEAPFSATFGAISANWQVFALGGLDRPSDTGCFAHQIWQSGVLVYDLIPYGYGSLVNKVDGAIYSNDGTGTLTTQYAPALAQPTKSVATFDGVGDYVSLGYAIDGTANASATVVYEFDYIMPTTEQAIAFFGGFGGILENAGYSENKVFWRPSTADWLNNSHVVDIAAYFDGLPHTFKFVRSSLALTMFIDGNLELSATMSVSGAFGASPSRICYTSLNGVTGMYPRYGDVPLTGFRRSINGVETENIPFTAIEGKTTTVIPDTSGNGNDGTVVVGPAGLDGFWGKRIADPNGVVVDAADYRPLSVQGGALHNGSPSTYDGKTFTELRAESTDTTSLTRTRLDAAGRIQLRFTRLDTTADPIIEAFLGN